MVEAESLWRSLWRPIVSQLLKEIRPKLVFFKPFVNRDGFSALEQIVRLYKKVDL